LKRYCTGISATLADSVIVFFAVFIVIIVVVVGRQVKGCKMISRLSRVAVVNSSICSGCTIVVRITVGNLTVVEFGVCIELESVL
jgi:hypothetical protein